MNLMEKEWVTSHNLMSDKGGGYLVAGILIRWGRRESENPADM